MRWKWGLKKISFLSCALPFSQRWCQERQEENTALFLYNQQSCKREGSSVSTISSNYSCTVHILLGLEHGGSNRTHVLGHGGSNRTHLLEVKWPNGHVIGLTCPVTTSVISSCSPIPCSVSLNTWHNCSAPVATEPF